jgi:hypothetical protein
VLIQWLFTAEAQVHSQGSACDKMTLDRLLPYIDAPYCLLLSLRCVVGRTSWLDYQNLCPLLGFTWHLAGVRGRTFDYSEVSDVRKFDTRCYHFQNE